MVGISNIRQLEQDDYRVWLLALRENQSFWSLFLKCGNVQKQEKNFENSLKKKNSLNDELPEFVIYSQTVVN